MTAQGIAVNSWANEPSEEVLIRYGAGPAGLPGISIPTVFAGTVTKYSNLPALHYKDSKDAPWTVYTWREYFEECKLRAMGFLSYGLPRFASVAILGFNHPEWFFSCIGAIFAGGLSAGVYPTSTPESILHVLLNSDCGIVIVEDKTQMAKLVSIMPRLPLVACVAQYRGAVDAALADQLRGLSPHPAGLTVCTSGELRERAVQANNLEALQARMADQHVNQCSTLIYTSGTTGPPKGVMLSHDNITWTAHIMAQQYGIGAGDRLISYLPLSHVAAQMLDIHGPIMCGAQVYFAQPDALRGSLKDTLCQVRPTVFLAVPRVWEKMMEAMTAIGRAAGCCRRGIASWGRGIGARAFEAILHKLSLPCCFCCANCVVLQKVRSALGLDQCKIQLTGAAPITQATLEFFSSFNIPLFELYGMSECSGPETIQFPGLHKPRTCGPALPGTELRIDHNPARDKPEEGEIIWRGRNVFMGYCRNPEATAATIDADGFLHSGDVGKLDSDGFLSITGRIKELIITAGGENIPPVLIEDEVKQHLSVISNIMLVGDKRKFLTCLITLKCQQNPDGTTYSHDLVPSVTRELAEAGIPDITNVNQLAPDQPHFPAFAKFIDTGMQRANSKAASAAQKIGKWTLIPTDFSVPEELTATLKLQRAKVAQKYANEIELMYAGADG
eukprot:gnl/Spiro4/12189_TR6433_c0_g1_i1.p1 gnl/Spiro4/12189_TR6433_c0_g1~~gnl/Spiro4/12189_TR6433_c0_g1_i1.p1  ORF type:complete len:687 (+),score=162.59 gnl/Spiro4/12189_TR6433_c0_g1_i1:46-2061(+)